MKPVDMLGLQIKEEILRKLIYDFVFKIRVFELRCICVIYRPGGRGGGGGRSAYIAFVIIIMKKKNNGFNTWKIMAVICATYAEA